MYSHDMRNLPSSDMCQVSSGILRAYERIRFLRGTQNVFPDQTAYPAMFRLLTDTRLS